MKKALRQEFYEQMHTILPDLYQKAYALKGNKIEAEMLTENILLRGAKQFSALANKARFRDILLQKIETGTHMDLEATDLDALAARVMEKIEKKDNIKKMVWGVCAGVLSVGIFVTVIIPNYPSNIPDEQTTPEATTAKDVNGEIINPTLPVIGEVTMKDTKTIKGDNKVIFFENYHNLSKALQKNTSPNIVQADYYTEIERYSASVVAPNGTTYMVFNNITNEKNGNITFTLYRMEQDGWHAIAEGDSQVMYNDQTYDSYFASRIYITADQASNIYVFVLWEDAVTVYRYDCRTGEFIKSDAVLQSASPNNDTTFYIYADKDYGEIGGVYVGYANGNGYDFACYDMAKNEYVYIVENVASSDAKMMFCAKDSVVHMILQANYGVKYYRIEEDGTVASKTLFAGSILGESEYICNRNSGAGGIAVDENGVAHVIATHCIKKTENNPYHLVHYQITSDLTIEKETLPKLYYTDTHTYDPLCMGVFMSDDNEIYYIEKYKEFGVDSMYVLAIGKLNVDGAFSYVDTLELPNEITRGGSRLFNSILTFYSDNNIYYCVIKE